MAFDLEIEFVGLCMFVPDPAGRVVYVLMPAAGIAQGALGMPQHVARLCVDTRYLQPPGSAAGPGLVAQVPLDRVSLAFTGPPPLDPTIPGVVAAVPNLVSLLACTGDPGPGLTARVTLGAGSVTRTGQAMCWYYPTLASTATLTTTVTWTIPGVDGDVLSVLLSQLDGNPLPAVPPPLYPINGLVQVRIFHTERDLLPPFPMDVPPPPRGTPAAHFAAYNLLFDPPAQAPVPVFYGFSCDDTQGAVPYTCMGPAQAQLPG
jgi:hypothetical protein